MSGYVRLHRDLIDHPAFRNDAEAMAFAWMFARAAWKQCRVRYKGRPITLERGQLAISIRDMATALDRDKAWVERLFKRLKGETMIETLTEAGVSVVTICNYDKYQPKKDTDEAPCETPGETDTRQGRDTEQIREEVKKEDNPPKPPRKRGGEGKHLLPEDWELPSVESLTPKAKACAEQWTSESYETHGEAFANYWRSRRGMNSDWRLTWCNRIVALHSQVMRDQKFGNAPAPASNDVDPKKWTAERRAEYARRVNDGSTGPPGQPIKAILPGIMKQAGAG